MGGKETWVRRESEKSKQRSSPEMRVNIDRLIVKISKYGEKTGLE